MEDATRNLSAEELEDLALELAWQRENSISPELDEFDAEVRALGLWDRLPILDPEDIRISPELDQFDLRAGLRGEW